MQPLKIGVFLPPSANLATQHLHQLAALASIAIEVEYFECNEGQHHQSANLLQTGRVDAMLHWLNDLSIELPESISLTALLPRLQNQVGLLVAETAIDMHQEFRVKPSTKLITRHVLLASQLKTYRSDIQIKDQQDLDLTKAEGFLISEHEMQTYFGAIPANHQWFPIDPREIVPIAGTGALVLQTLKDHHQVRTMLKPLHDRATSQSTNVERGFERAFAVGEGRKTAAAHCQQDQAGNYHAHFCIMDHDGVAHRTMISQSTHAGLADKAISWARAVCEVSIS
jgi:porphobilinogen deaminase